MKTRLLSSALATLLIVPLSAHAQIHVLLSGGFRSAYDKLLPDFEQRTGIRVTTSQGFSQGNGPDTIAAQLRRGAHADVVIMSRGGFDDLIAGGQVQAGAVMDVATVDLGASVRAGAPKPDISTVDAFKRALLNAKSVGSDSTAALYVENQLLPKLGIAAEIKPKFMNVPPAAVASGKVELEIDPISAVANTPGADYVGPLPPELQLSQTFSAAPTAGSHQQAAARRLIAFLRSKHGQAIIRTSGMKPLR